MAPNRIEIGFNARYLMDILQQIEGDTVEVHLADAAAPTLLRENDKQQRALRPDADAGLTRLPLRDSRRWLAVAGGGSGQAPGPNSTAQGRQLLAGRRDALGAIKPLGSREGAHHR